MGIGDWVRKLWEPTGWGPAPAVDTTELARLVGLAEDAIDRMQDAPQPRAAYQDAGAHMDRAIAEAERLGLASEVARLRGRRDDVDAAYNRLAGR